MARGIARLATDEALRTRLQTGAQQHAATLTWTNTATRIMEVLADEALGRPRTHLIGDETQADR